MGKETFDTWARSAVKQMRFFPDREAARKELEDHLRDRRADFLEQGMKMEEAEAAAVRAMGDAVQTGKLLNKAHSPWLGFAWLLSKIASIVLVIVLTGALLLDSTMANRWKNHAATVFGWESCTCYAQFDGYGNFETRQPIEAGLALREGDYVLTLDHGFYYLNPIDDGGEQFLTVAFWVKADHFWQTAPQALEEYLCAVDDLGNEYVLEGRSLFQVDTADVGLPVWMVHIRLFLPYDGPLVQRQWFRFYVPDTDLAFTVWTNGEVSS